MKNTTRFGVLAGTLVMAMSALSPAQAARQSTTDTARDVVKAVCAGECTTPTQTVDASRVEGDIKSLVTNHGTTSVVVRVAFTDLYPHKQTRVLDIALRTNEGLSREAIVYFDPTAPSQGDHFLVSNSTGNQLNCAGFTSKADYGYNTITLTIPRSCLSYPLSVKTGAVYARFPQGFEGDTAYVDDARLDGQVTTSLAPIIGTAVAKG